jgi:hypothetical protein
MTRLSNNAQPNLNKHIFQSSPNYYSKATANICQQSLIHLKFSIVLSQFITKSRRYYGKNSDLIWTSNETCKLGPESFSQQDSLFLHYIFKMEYFGLLISKLCNSKTQIHLHIQDYNFHEGLQVR